MRLFRWLFRAVGFLVWLPFAAAVNITLLVLTLGLVFWFAQPFFWPVALVWGVCFVVAANVEPHLRPTALPPKLKSLKTKAVGWATASILVKTRGTSPRVSTITRKLSPEIQTILRQPRDQQPAALAFEQPNDKLRTSVAA